MSLFTDMGQDDRIDEVEQRVKRLEAAVGRSSDIRLLKELAGHTVVINADDFYEEKVKILDIDDEWIKIELTDKKGRTTTQLIRISSVDSVTLSD